MKRILSLAIGVLLLAGLSSVDAQDSQFAIETIPLESQGFNMTLSPDDQTLAVYENFNLLGSNETVPDLLPIRLIDINTGETIGSLSGHTDWITAIAFSPDGERLISFHRNGDLVLWDVEGLNIIKTIHTYSFGGGWVQFLPDGKTVLYRAGEFISGLLDTETEAITKLFGPDLESFYEFGETYTQFPGRGDIALAAEVVSPDGKWRATSSQNDEVKLIDIESGEEWTLREPSEKFARLAVRPLVFSQDSTQLVYFDRDLQQTHWWDVVAREEIRAVDFGGQAFALAPDTTTIAWADRDTSAIYIADTATDDEPRQVIALPENLDVAPGITSLAFTSDGAKLVIGGLHERDEENVIYVVDLGAE